MLTLFRTSRPTCPPSAALTSGRPAWFSRRGSSSGVRSDSATTRPSGAISVTRAPAARAARPAKAWAAASAPGERGARVVVKDPSERHQAGLQRLHRERLERPVQV